jgi:putative MATE family efflux protein
MLGGMAFDTLYSLTDAFFAARVSGGAEAALAGVGAAGPLMFLMVALAQGIGAGVSIEAGIAAGAKDRRRLEGIASSGLALALAGGIGVAALFLAFARPLIRLAAGGAAAEILDAGSAYLRWLAPGLPCLFAGHALFALRQGEGLTKRYGVAMAVSTATNAILDPILMNFAGLGIAGNAMGTSASQAIFLILAVAAARADEGSGAFSPRLSEASREAAGRILGIGIPQSLSFVALGLSQGAANLVLASRGAEALAAHTIANRFEGIALVPTLAFSAAACILVTQARGAGDREGAREAFRGGVAVVGAGSFILCAAIAAASVPLCSLLAGDAALGSAAAVGAAILAAGSALGHSSGILGAQLLLAAERPMASLGVQVLRLIALPAPMALAATAIFGGQAAVSWAGLAAGTSLGGLASLAIAASALRREPASGPAGAASPGAAAGAEGRAATT